MVERLPAPALELCGVTRRFGSTLANDSVSFSVPAGTIHGIVGENGAGKSTVMTIVHGLVRADAGQVLVHGRRLQTGSSAAARAAGIGMVHQHFMLVEEFTALENILLGEAGDQLLARRSRQVRQQVMLLARNHGLDVDLDCPVGELSVGARQWIEILRALHHGADLLILDEPTAVLSPPETERLFALLRGLKGQGRTIVIITHKLREVMALTDQVTVMRQGRVVATLATSTTDPDGLASLMMGRPVSLPSAGVTAPRGPELLRVRGLRVADDAGGERVRGVDFDLHGGEIVGIAGVTGNGQSELLEALAGIRPVRSGSAVAAGQELFDRPDPFTVKRLRAVGISHIPEEAGAVGLIGDFPVRECAILGRQDEPRWTGPLFMRSRAILEFCRKLIGDYDIRPDDPDGLARQLSGGNQQKLVLAREIERDPAILLVGQPTRGVDVGAVESIHRRLLGLREQGKAILLVSAELDEILALADRVLVMLNGRIVGEIPARQADEGLIGRMMSGVTQSGFASADVFAGRGAE